MSGTALAAGIAAIDRSARPDASALPLTNELARQLAEPRRRMQVVTGARQAGKTTLLQQLTEHSKV